MEVVNGLMLDRSVGTVDLVDELGNLRRKGGRVSGRRRRDLHQDDFVGPFGIVVKETLVSAKLEARA